MSLLRCLKCGAKVDCGSERCVCPQCGQEWPVVGGIPRFFQFPTYYWGEVGREEARDLLESARRGSWVEAVKARFPEQDNMTYGMLDLQRASWAPMLGLGEDSVALDIGSGYGAITQSLSRFAGEVYSVEAIPDRIEFTQERLRQEGISNVRLLQASAAQLPLAEGSFDLVVLNGVLEWFGEWDLSGDTRSVQLGFLRAVRRLLKSEGALVLGIENRFGYGLFLGSRDHSGIAYTSLVPRKVASVMLRHSSQTHHRTQLNAKKEYRTFTYTERGYRKLLSEAGFASVACYWADPGYNRPYHLVPFTMPQWIREHFTLRLDQPGRQPRRSWRRRLKRWLAGAPLLPYVMPDFLLIAKNSNRSTQLERWMAEQLPGRGADRSGPITWALRTMPYRSKSIVRVGDRSSGRDLAYIKINPGDKTSEAKFEAELANRAKVQLALDASSNGLVTVPRPYSSLRLGGTSYRLESPARYTQFSKLVRLPDYFTDLRRVRTDFLALIEGIVTLTEDLQKIDGIAAIAASWRALPKEIEGRPESCALSKIRYFRDEGPAGHRTLIQHGDLSVENLFFQRETGQIEVIDWADLASGFPPLYDIFHFLYSASYLTPSEGRTTFPSELERWIASFKSTFLAKNGFAIIVSQLIHDACERLKIDPKLIPSLLIEFLIIRSHYYKEGSVQRNVHIQLLEMYAEGTI